MRGCSSPPRDPALERIALVLGSGVAPPAANGTAANGASPQARVKPLRPPTPRQQTLWKAIRQAQLQGLSIRAIARVLGISRNTVRRYVLAAAHPDARVRHHLPAATSRADMFAEQLSGQRRCRRHCPDHYPSADFSMADTTSRGRHDGATRIGADDDHSRRREAPTVTQRGRHVGPADQTTLMEAWLFVDPGLCNMHGRACVACI